jgi:hypothetical protein
LRTSNFHCYRSLMTRQLLLSVAGNFIELTAVSASGGSTGRTPKS